jgi:hypothetical protein
MPLKPIVISIRAGRGNMARNFQTAHSSFPTLEAWRSDPNKFLIFLGEKKEFKKPILQPSKDSWG